MPIAHKRVSLEPAARRPLLVVTEQQQFMSSTVFPWKIPAVPATSAVLDRMFSVTGNIMTEKRARLTCDHFKEFTNLPEVWAKVREKRVIEKARLSWWINVAHAHTHAHEHTQKNKWVVFLFPSSRQTIHDEQKAVLMSRILFLHYTIYVHLRMIKF